MKFSNTTILFLSLIVNFSDAYAVSFDCNKATRTSEKTICSNVELSGLDDELSVAYRNAISITPDIKSSQREWIKATRLCENNPSTLEQCIKSAYKSRIAILTNEKKGAQAHPESIDARPNTVPQDGAKSKNEVIAIKNPPARISQQQKMPQALQPLQVQPQDASVTQKASSSLDGKSNTKQTPVISINKSGTPLTASVFNLKGFHLNMTKDDVKKIIQNPKYKLIETIGAKELGGFDCGVALHQPPSGCKFTYAGEEITGITVSFWGDRAYEIQFYFGPYRRSDHTSSSGNFERRMRAALDTKYLKESNTTGPNGNMGSVWQSDSEIVKFEYVEDTNLFSNSLILRDTKYRDDFETAYISNQKNKQNIEKQNNTKKLLSDM